MTDRSEIQHPSRQTLSHACRQAQWVPAVDGNVLALSLRCDRKTVEKRRGLGIIEDGILPENDIFLVDMLSVSGTATELRGQCLTCRH